MTYTVESTPLATATFTTIDVVPFSRVAIYMCTTAQQRLSRKFMLDYKPDGTMLFWLDLPLGSPESLDALFLAHAGETELVVADKAGRVPGDNPLVGFVVGVFGFGGVVGVGGVGAASESADATLVKRYAPGVFLLFESVPSSASATYTADAYTADKCTHTRTHTFAERPICVVATEHSATEYVASYNAARRAETG